MLYNPENTLIICTDKYLELIKEAAAGYKLVQLPSFGIFGIYDCRGKDYSFDEGRQRTGI